MEHMVITGSLPGYEGCNTIRLVYMISPGIQVRLDDLTTLFNLLSGGF